MLNCGEFRVQRVKKAPIISCIMQHSNTVVVIFICVIACLLHQLCDDGLSNGFRVPAAEASLFACYCCT